MMETIALSNHREASVEVALSNHREASVEVGSFHNIPTIHLLTLVEIIILYNYIILYVPGNHIIMIPATVKGNIHPGRIAYIFKFGLT